MNKVLNNVMKVLKPNKFVSTGITLSLIMYAGIIAPSLPAKIAVLFGNSLFKFVYLMVVLLLVSQKQYTHAILAAVAFIVSLSTLSKYNTYTKANSMSKGQSDPIADLANSDVDVNAVSDITTNWHSSKGKSTVTLRGNDYDFDDGKNHLPGGHGVMNPNDLVQSQSVGPVGYQGGDYSTIGEHNSQL
jgi:hypothetical protein